MEWLLAQTIEAAASAKVIKQHSLDKVIVDSTVQEKAIAYPTDSKLLNRGRQQLVQLSRLGSRSITANSDAALPRG